MVKMLKKLKMISKKYGIKIYGISGIFKLFFLDGNTALRETMILEIVLFVRGQQQKSALSLNLKNRDQPISIALTYILVSLTVLLNGMGSNPSKDFAEFELML